MLSKRETIEINQMVVVEGISAANITKDYSKKELIQIYETNIKF